MLVSQRVRRQRLGRVPVHACPRFRDRSRHGSPRGGNQANRRPISEVPTWVVVVRLRRRARI